MSHNFTLVYGNDIRDFSEMADCMFRDRKMQFHEKLGWDLQIDDRGREIDEYDRENPLYIIMHDGHGSHVGSTRLLPTTGPTMIADHFSDLTDGVAIASPAIWECTRFFVAHPGAKGRAAAALMWAGCKFGLRSGVEFYVGVTAMHMVRVFQSCGWPAEVLGSRASAEGEICACLWEISAELCDQLADRAGISPGQDLHVHQRFPVAKNSGRVLRTTGVRVGQPELVEADAM